VSGPPTAGAWAKAAVASPVVLVTAVGAATGSRAAAAALACTGSEPNRAALLIELVDGRPPRPSLVATAGARELEERLTVHLPDAGVASRGSICLLKLPPDEGGIEQIAAALPLVRGSAAVVHLPPAMLQPALAETRIRPTAGLFRADLDKDRPLAALAARNLLDRGLRVAVLKHPLPWLAARAAQLGALPANSSALPARARRHLLSSEDKTFPHCYDQANGAKGEQHEIGRAQR
jgi:hypothetical protein